MTKRLPDWLPAVRGLYRPPRSTKIRITPENCVLELDLWLLEKAQPVTCVVSVPGKLKERTFTRLRVNDEELFADRTTGTLYDAKTGRSSSPHLSIAESRG